MKRIVLQTLVIISLVSFTLFGTGCPDDKSNPYIPPALNFDLLFHNNHAPQSDINESVQLEGWLTTTDGERRAGYKVRFSVEPSGRGRVTPNSRPNLDINTDHGFDLVMHFVGEEYGVAVIYADVLDDVNSRVAGDTLSINVMEPGNEE